MTDAGPVTGITGRFVDDVVAKEAAEALNAWFHWIVAGSEMPTPEVFEPLGVSTADYAWSLEEDVDWQLGPHARAVACEVRVSLETHDTHLHLAGLLRRLGALAVGVAYD